MVAFRSCAFTQGFPGHHPPWSSSPTPQGLQGAGAATGAGRPESRRPQPLCTWVARFSGNLGPKTCAGFAPRVKNVWGHTHGMNPVVPSKDTTSGMGSQRVIPQHQRQKESIWELHSMNQCWRMKRNVTTGTPAINFTAALP